MDNLQKKKQVSDRLAKESGLHPAATGRMINDYMIGCFSVHVSDEMWNNMLLFAEQHFRNELELSGKMKEVKAIIKRSQKKSAAVKAKRNIDPFLLNAADHSKAMREGKI